MQSHQRVVATVNVDRTKSFVPHPFLTTEYGEMKVVWDHPLAMKVTTFDLENDVSLINLAFGNEMLTALQIRDRALNEGHVPLDALCAQIIWENKKFLEIVNRKRDFSRRLETVNFVGSVLSCGKYEHIISYKYPYYGFNPKCVIPFEASDEAWGKNDPVLVFHRGSHLVKNLVNI